MPITHWSHLFAAMAGACGVLCLIQAAVLRRRIPRLGGPSDAPEGVVPGEGCTLRILVVGESSAAGVGVRSHRLGIAGRLATALNDRLGCTVRWRTLGFPGATALRVTRELERVPTLPHADIAVIALGVNDALRLRSPFRWYRHLARLRAVLASKAHCGRVLLCPAPPLWCFRCLPVPLRCVWGAQAWLLDRISRRFASDHPDVHYVPIPFGDQAVLLCEDRFHPSAQGYAVWGEHLAQALVPETGRPRERAARVRSVATVDHHRRRIDRIEAVDTVDPGM